MKERQKQAHMKAAQVYADLSYCNRLKVGCVFVKDDRIISIGYNGTPAGEDNNCEDADGNTKPTVIHAEHNASLKLGPGEAAGATVFVTHSPCKQCAEILIADKVSAVMYINDFRTADGVELLRSQGIPVTKISQ